MNSSRTEAIHEALNHLRIETPSWGYADTGTRFGKFFQPAAAIDLNDKFADAGEVNRLTGCCPLVAVHVLWDFRTGDTAEETAKLARANGVRVGSINANLFEEQPYKYGSFGNSDESIRQTALDHVFDCIDLAKQLDNNAVTLWFADGTNYPGQDSIRSRKQRFEACIRRCHERLAERQVLLIEYKPFEPAFYQTDVADWGMAYLYSRKAGPQARVLVDTGHHYLAQNIEQIVAWLLDEEMLGGFHFNDRRYADDDLTMASIDPYQIFRIFHEIHSYAAESGQQPDIAYMIDQSHNLKPKIEAMVQTVGRAQELFAKAAIVDRQRLSDCQRRADLIASEETLQDAFATDVRPAVASWREANSLPVDPLSALRDGGYLEATAASRSKRRGELGIVQASSYA